MKKLAIAFPQGSLIFEGTEWEMEMLKTLFTIKKPMFVKNKPKGQTIEKIIVDECLPTFAKKEGEK